MKIAIVGAGTVGEGLAPAATKAGHEVVVSAGDPDSARVVSAFGAVFASFHAIPTEHGQPSGSSR